MVSILCKSYAATNPLSSHKLCFAFKTCVRDVLLLRLTMRNEFVSREEATRRKSSIRRTPREEESDPESRHKLADLSRKITQWRQETRWNPPLLRSKQEYVTAHIRNNTAQGAKENRGDEGIMTFSPVHAKTRLIAPPLHCRFRRSLWHTFLGTSRLFSRAASRIPVSWEPLIVSIAAVQYLHVCVRLSDGAGSTVLSLVHVPEGNGGHIFSSLSFPPAARRC